MIGERIAKARKNSGFKDQKSLSDRLKSIGAKVAPRTLADYELNKSEPKVSTIKAIAEICNVSYNWLIDGKGDMLRDDSGISNYNNQERLDDAMNMYADLPNEDKNIIYAIIKRYHSTIDAKEGTIEKKLEQFDNAFEE